MSGIKQLLREGVTWNFLSMLFQWPNEAAARAARQLADELPSHLKNQASNITLHYAEPSLESAYHYLLGSGGCMSPYESHYSQPEHSGMREKGMVLGDVAAFYKAFGFAYARKNPEAPDHIAAELAFLGFLRLKEAFAFSQDLEEARRICRDAETAFLRDHLLVWTPAFISQILRSSSHTFYVKAAHMLHDFTGKFHPARR